MIGIKKIFVAVLLCTSFLFSSPFAHAIKSWDEIEAERDAAEEVAADSLSAAKEMGSSVYGRVIDVSPSSNRLSLLPTDMVENEDLEVAMGTSPFYFQVQAKTTYTGIRSLNDIAPGDFLTIDYYEFRGENIAQGIVFEKIGENHYSTATTNPSSQKDLADFPVILDSLQESGTQDLVG